MKETATDTKPTQRNTKRYSDQELEVFRLLVNNRLNEALQDYQMLRSAISNEGNGTDDTAPSFRLTEDLSDVFSREEMAALAVRRQRYIHELRNALVRIENKTYGICRVTGELIPPERLRTVPHTTMSMTAKAAGL